jgi:CHAD domain-containing protein
LPEQAVKKPPVKKRAAKEPTVKERAIDELGRAYDGYLKKAAKARRELLLEYSPKSMHAWRVNLRRITATLDRVAPMGKDASALLDRFKGFRNTTGSCRDLDILLDQTLPAFLSATQAAPLPADLQQKLQAERERLQQEAVAGLREADLDSAGEELRAWYRGRTESDAQLKAIAAELIETRFQQLHRRAKRMDEGRKRLHRVRTATKKLRYSMELFQSLFPKRATAHWLERLAELQTQLGETHDCMTGRALCRGLLPGAKGDPSVKTFRRWAKEAAHDATAKAQHALEQLGKLAHYWRH